MMKQITSKIQLKRTKKIKTQGFSKSFANNIAINNNSKKPISYRPYTDKQMVDFISLIVEMVPLKDITSKTRMTLSTAYHFEKMWNKNEKVPEKKRNRAKKDVLKVERTLFTMKLADNFALMTLEQLRENLIEKYPSISISKTQSYCLIAL